MGVKRTSTQRGALSLRNGAWTLRVRRGAQIAGEVGFRRGSIRVGSKRNLRTRAAARKEADRILDRMAITTPTTGRAIAFDEFAEIYLADQVSVMEESTLASYRSIVRHHLVPALKSTPMHEIAGRKPAAVVGALAKSKLSRPSIRAAMGVLGRMLDVASALGYASVPLNRRTYRLPPAAAFREPRCFTPAESRKIIEGASYPWRAFYALMAYAGLRCSEALGIEWAHIDLQARQLHIRQAATHGKLKTVKSRNSAADLPIADELHSILREYHAQLPAQPDRIEGVGLLFESPRSGPYWASSIYRHFMPLLERLKIKPAGLHAFRHGHATNLFAGGASAPVVRGMLRHGDIKTTLRYTHITGEDMRQAAAAAGKIIGGGIAA